MTDKRISYKRNKVRQARLRAEIGTQKELAELTGISATIISDLERGKRSMSPNWAMRIAEAVGIDWRELMDEETAEYKNSS